MVSPRDGMFSELLDSGVQVVGQPMPGVESAAIGVVIGTGARDESAPRFGISHFTEQMLFRGTEHYDARALSERFDELGISYDSSAGLEMTLLSAVLLGDRVPQAIDLLADVVRYPTFPADTMENVRALLIQEIQQREDQPGQKVMDVLRQRFYAGNPLGHDVLGTEESVGTLSRDDLRQYWSDRYTANNIVVSVAGNFEPEAVVAQLQEVTASWPTGRGRSLVSEPAPQTGFMVLSREASQENLGFAFPGVPVGDPHYHAAALFSQVLGGGSNSRLYQEVREKRGLAYAVQSRFDGLERAGLFRIYCGTSVERAHESVEVILDVLRNSAETGVSEEELALAKTRLKSQLIMRSDSTAARMVANLRSWWFENVLRTLDDLQELVNAVTCEEILSLVQTLRITDNLAAIALGPLPEEEIFASVLAQS